MRYRDRYTYRRGITGLTLLALLVGAVVLRPADPTPVVRTVPLGPITLYGATVALDPRAGEAFVGSTGDESGDSRLRVLDVRDGTVLHTILLPGAHDQLVTLAAAASAGHAFITQATTMLGSASVGMFDARSGRRLDTIALDADLYPGFWNMAIDPSPRGGSSEGRVFVVSTIPYNSVCTGAVGCSRASVLDAATGRLRHAFRLPGQAGNVAVDAGTDRLIVAGNDSSGSNGTVSVLDASSGRLLHSSATGGFPSNSWDPYWHYLAVDATTARAFALSTRFPRDSGTVYVFDTRSGRLVHTIPMSHAPIALAVDERSGRVFVATAGPLRARSNSGGTPDVPVGDGSISVLDARSGALVRTLRAGMLPTAVDVDARRGHVLVANAGALVRGGAFAGPGSVETVDEQTGAVLHTTPVGVLPRTLMVDENAGRAIVVNAGGPVRVTDAWHWVPRWAQRWLPFLPRPSAAIRVDPGSVTVLDTTR